MKLPNFQIDSLVQLFIRMNICKVWRRRFIKFFSPNGFLAFYKRRCYLMHSIHPGYL
jgi:hypothetical protein